MELEPGYSFAASKEISGDPDSWGQNLRDACKAHIKYGGLPAPNTIEGTEEEKTLLFQLEITLSTGY